MVFYSNLHGTNMRGHHTSQTYPITVKRNYRPQFFSHFKHLCSLPFFLYRIFAAEEEGIVGKNKDRK